MFCVINISARTLNYDEGNTEVFVTKKVTFDKIIFIRY